MTESIFRKIDSLGKVVVPKIIRELAGLHEGDMLQIVVTETKDILLINQKKIEDKEGNLETEKDILLTFSYTDKEGKEKTDFSWCHNEEFLRSWTEELKADHPNFKIINCIEIYSYSDIDLIN